MFIIDSNSVRRAVSILVKRDHHWNSELLKALFGKGNADITTKIACQPVPLEAVGLLICKVPGVLDNPSHGLRCALARGHDDITFVFSAFVVHDYDRFPACKGSQGVFH